MYTTVAYPTPFQRGGLMRSLVLGFFIFVSFSVAGDKTSSGGDKFFGVLLALGLIALIINRVLASRFYTAMPEEMPARLAISLHDLLGTLGLLFILLILWLIGLVIDAFAGTSTSGRVRGGSKTAISKDGVVYKKSFWTGQWQPEQGIFGPKSDRGLFGPNIEQGFSGPVEKRDGFFDQPQYGSDGRKLYGRK